MQLAVDTAVLLGADPTKARGELEEAIKFEIQLANVRNLTKMSIFNFIF